MSAHVFRPSHYARFIIEPVTFINANGIGFNRGNSIKYLCRAGHKDATAEIDDLKKARRYIDIEIETLERQARIDAGEDPSDVWKTIL
jgi:Protein of unknwon function (DUF3310)